jgi:hypothetical protein
MCENKFPCCPYEAGWPLQDELLERFRDRLPEQTVKAIEAEVRMGRESHERFKELYPSCSGPIADHKGSLICPIMRVAQLIRDPILNDGDGQPYIPVAEWFNEDYQLPAEETGHLLFGLHDVMPYE